MSTTSKSKLPFRSFGFAHLALAGLVALPACFDLDDSGSPGSSDGEAGRGSMPIAGSAGTPAQSNAGTTSNPGEMPEAGSGGSTAGEEPAGVAGREPTVGGSTGNGGSEPVLQGGAPDVEPIGGAPGNEPVGGTAGSSGGAEIGGAGGAPSDDEESLCFDESGAPVPYDYSIGLISEYAFELSMSCEVGGFLLPLVLEDPETLSGVNVFVAEATDWYRTHVLNCADATSTLGADAFGLLPSSQTAGMSNPDADASTALFFNVLARHDLQPDAVSAPKKEKIKKRIKSAKHRAVSNSEEVLTKSLSGPDCVPAEPGGSGTQ